jgi:hypothetical protein
LAANDPDVSRDAGTHLGHRGRTEGTLRHPDDVASTLDELVRHDFGSHHDQDVHVVRA